MKNKIYISGIKLSPAENKMIKKAVNKAALSLTKNPCEVSVSIVSAQEIRSLNASYRAKDSVTDVLSFPLGEEWAGDYQLLGDIVICYEKAVAQAEEYGHSLERELSFLTVHSMLHLFGFDHEQGEADRLMMEEKTKEIMQILGVPRGERNQDD